MAYFKTNEPEAREEQRLPEAYAEEYYDESEYDDGLDDPLYEEEPEEMSTEEAETLKKHRIRIAMGAGNLVAVIGGIVLVLLLLTLLFNMIYFVSNDMQRNFTLLQTKM